MTALRVSRTAWPVTVLGPGSRAVVWTQGCTIGCAGCASTDTWDPLGGNEMHVEDLLAWLAAIGEPLEGVSLSGGEPFQQPEALAALIAGVRELHAEVDVLVFSGYTPRRLNRDPDLRSIAESCDAVVAGPYLARSGYGGWLRGSANQELLLFSDLGRRRFAGRENDDNALQIQTSDGQVDVIGIPRPGDLDRIAAALEQRGWGIGEATWRR
jgi:anaerobic ribonucleoside-triphosphate reductase activating protein